MKRLTMRAELHTWNRLSCPSGSGNFFIWLFSCLSSVVLSIIKTNNLHIRRRFITPPKKTDCISISYAKASHRCAGRHTKHFLCPYAACAISVPLQTKKPQKHGWNEPDKENNAHGAAAPVCTSAPCGAGEARYGLYIPLRHR